MLFIFLILFAGCINTGKKRFVKEELREAAIENLRETLDSDLTWEKVHAAEFLLELGYVNEVHNSFIEEEKKRGKEHFYRIGIWRVLAQSTYRPEEKEVWMDSIAIVFGNPDSPDRIHAAESLAKLNYFPFREDNDQVQSILEGDHNSLWLYTLWATSYSKDRNIEKVKNLLTDIVTSYDEPNSLRRLAAYGLRNIKDVGLDNYKLLLNTALSEPDTSAAYSNIVSSAYINTPSDSLSTISADKCRQKLLDIISDPAKEGRYEALLAISETADQEELPLLSSFIASQNNRSFGSELDIYNAASYVILRIDRREKYTLHGWDKAIIALYGIVMILIGWYFARRVSNTEDYLLGGRKMKPFIVGLSLFITMLSSLSFLSYPGEMIKNGPVVFIAMIIFPLIYYIVGWFLIPHFMKMKVTSAYELLEVRLGLNVRMLATFFFLTLRFFWMATIIYATINTALMAVIDIPSRYTAYIGIILMLVTILYTTIGGYKAVIATDAIQSVILWAGTILAILFVMVEFNSVTSWLPDHYLGHWATFKWGVSLQERTTIGNTMIFLVTWYVCTNGSDQMAVQRYLSTKDISAARRSFGISLIVTFFVKIFLAVAGLAMIAYFTRNPHFLSFGQTLNEQADSLLPKFILIGLPVGISGLVVSAILAAAMSSLSSGLNSASSVIHEDIIKRVIPRFVSSNPLRQVKKISFFVGIVAILLSLLVGNVEGNLLDVVIKVVNLFVAPLFVLFFMAIFIPFATGAGTIIGGLASVIMAVAVAFWEFGGLKVFWIMPAAFIAGAIAGIIGSIAGRWLIR